MRAFEVHDYARGLYDAHGDKAEAEAAQKARKMAEMGNLDQAGQWRRISAAIKEMRGA